MGHQALLTQEQVLSIANARALKANVDLSGYDVRIEFEFTEKNHKWYVFYNGTDNVVGNDFLILVDDITGETHLFGGS